MNIRQKFRQILDKTGYVKQLHKEIDTLKYNSFYPPGHFYSPIISVEAIKARQLEIWNSNEKNEISEIDLNVNKQISLINDLSNYYPEMPFRQTKQPKLRYYFDNDWYSYTDAIILYSIMRHFRPKQIIEIGSGFSSAVMLDTNEFFFDNSIKLTFIEPNPERLYNLMAKKDIPNTVVIKNDVQFVCLDTFTKLESGDFLFIDSSHVVKTGSDVNYIFFKILPLLKTGVVIHFHDIFFPFEYPKEWVFNGQNWNEDYFLHAFMMYNQAFKILVFSDYLHRFYSEAFQKMPLCYKNSGGNFWMTKN